MFHGVSNLDKAIELLPDKDRDDFKYFTRNENSFSRGNMFITKSPIIMNHRSIHVYAVDLQMYSTASMKICGNEFT